MVPLVDGWHAEAMLGNRLGFFVLLKRTGQLDLPRLLLVGRVLPADCGRLSGGFRVWVDSGLGGRAVSLCRYHHRRVKGLRVQLRLVAAAWLLRHRLIFNHLRRMPIREVSSSRWPPPARCRSTALSTYKRRQLYINRLQVQRFGRLPRL